MTTEPERWQLEGDSAESYEAYLVPSVTLPWARDLVERVGVEAGERVLDAACGTGASHVWRRSVSGTPDGWSAWT